MHKTKCFLLALDGFGAPVYRGGIFATLMTMPHHEVVIYSRKGCHLCEVAKQSLESLSHRVSFTWREVDIDADEELRALYNEEVPVVFINGRKAFKYRLNETEFLRKLQARS